MKLNSQRSLVPQGDGNYLMTDERDFNQINEMTRIA